MLQQINITQPAFDTTQVVAKPTFDRIINTGVNTLAYILVGITVVIILWHGIKSYSQIDKIGYFMKNLIIPIVILCICLGFVFSPVLNNIANTIYNIFR